MNYFDFEEELGNVDFVEASNGVPPEAAAFSMKDKKNKKDEFLGGSGSKENVNKEETHFPVTKSISKEEFDRKAKLNTKYNTFGSPILSPGTQNRHEGVANLDYDRGGVNVGVDVSSDVAKHLTEEQRQKLHIGIDGGRVSYNGKPLYEEDTEESHVEERRPSTYFINGEQPRYTDADQERVRRLSADDVARTIKETPDDGLIFYSGAGISRGGEKPIWGMNELNQEMHLNNGALAFVRELADHPAQLEERFRTFNESFYEDISTPAHRAIADIVRAKPDSIVITENFDLRHEAEGSRIEPVHLGSIQSHEDVNERAKKAKVLVTVGLSHDDRAAIAVLKKQNPDLKIIAFSLPTDQAPLPNFLSENDPNDAVVLGDCQQLLPEIAERLKKVEAETHSRGESVTRPMQKPS